MARVAARAARSSSAATGIGLPGCSQGGLSGCTGGLMHIDIPEPTPRPTPPMPPTPPDVPGPAPEPPYPPPDVLPPDQPPIPVRDPIPPPVRAVARALVFFLIAIFAALVGFGGITAVASSLAQGLFLFFIVIAVASLVMGMRGPD